MALAKQGLAGDLKNKQLAINFKYILHINRSFEIG